MNSLSFKQFVAKEIRESTMSLPYKQLVSKYLKSKGWMISNILQNKRKRPNDGPSTKLWVKNNRTCTPVEALASEEEISENTARDMMKTMENFYFIYFSEPEASKEKSNHSERDVSNKTPSTPAPLEGSKGNTVEVFHTPDNSSGSVSPVHLSVPDPVSDGENVASRETVVVENETQDAEDALVVEIESSHETDPDTRRCMKSVMKRFGGMTHFVKPGTRNTQNYVLFGKTTHCPLEAWRVFEREKPLVARHFSPQRVSKCDLCSGTCDKDWVMCTRSLDCNRCVHLKCACLKSAPEDSWFCPKCSSASATDTPMPDAPNDERSFLYMQLYGWRKVEEGGVVLYENNRGDIYSSFDLAFGAHKEAAESFAMERGWKTGDGGMWYNENHSKEVSSILEILKMEGAKEHELYPRDGLEDCIGQQLPEDEDIGGGEEVSEDEVRKFHEAVSSLTSELAKRILEEIATQEYLMEKGLKVLGAIRLVKYVERSTGKRCYMICGGYTQSEKTIFKIIKGIVAKRMGRKLVILTSTNDNRDELAYDKIGEAYKEMGYGEHDHDYIKVCNFEEIKKMSIGEFARVDVVVLTANDHQLKWTMENFGRSLDRGYEVIVDEADSYYDSGNTLRHKSLQWITTGKGFGKDINPPKAVTLISATLVSCLIKRVENERNLVDKLGKDDIFFTQNSKDYISAVSFKPFEYKGKSIFLKHEECNWEKKKMFLRDALKNKNSLVFDNSCPRVSQASSKREVNTMEKECDKVAAEFKKTICITFNGNGIRKLAPETLGGKHRWADVKLERKKGKRSRNEAKETRKMEKTLLAKVINDAMKEIKELWKDEGFLYIAAYHLLFRGIAPRSMDYAPTHLICMPTKGVSICDTVQCFGRASGNQKSLLEASGHDHVKVLCTKEDYADVNGYLNFMDYIKAELEKGRALNDIISDKSKYPANCRFTSNDKKEKKDRYRPIAAKGAKIDLMGEFEKVATTPVVSVPVPDLVPIATPARDVGDSTPYEASKRVGFNWRKSGDGNLHVVGDLHGDHVAKGIQAREALSDEPGVLNNMVIYSVDHPQASQRVSRSAMEFIKGLTASDSKGDRVKTAIGKPWMKLRCAMGENHGDTKQCPRKWRSDGVWCYSERHECLIVFTKSYTEEDLKKRYWAWYTWENETMEVVMRYIKNPEM